MNFLISILRQNFNPLDVQRIWIGLGQKSSSAQWSWSDGSLLDFSNWAGNQPNNNNGQKLCVEMDEKTGLMFSQGKYNH